MQFAHRAQEVGIEHLGRHHLAAAHQPDLVRTIIGDRAMDGAEVVPHQQVVLVPGVGVAEALFELEAEQVFQHLVALAFGEFVDPHRIAGIAVQHLPAGDRMGEEQRMHHRRTPAALFLGHRRAGARLVAAHVLPELLEVVRRGRIGEPRPDVGRQRVVGGVHVGELGAAERRAVAARDADAVQHVHEAHHVAIRHVGVPVLAGVGQADIFAALLQVRQRADMRFVLGIGRGAGSLDLAEALGECAQVADVELLIREAQHAVPAERQQDLGELRSRRAAPRRCHAQSRRGPRRSVQWSARVISLMGPRSTV